MHLCRFDVVVTVVQILFFDSFDADFDGRWTQSSDSSYGGGWLETRKKEKERLREWKWVAGVNGNFFHLAKHHKHSGMRFVFVVDFLSRLKNLLLRMRFLFVCLLVNLGSLPDPWATVQAEPR